VTESPLVSIVTPSFDQGAFIGDCVASVASQTYGNVEHVIADGGSQDGTLDVLRAAPEHVHWTSEPDRGQADAINKAFSRTRGEIVGWLNSDDAYFDRRAIEGAVETFRSRPEVDLVYGHAAVVGADNELLFFLWAPRFDARLLRYANFIVQPTVFVRRSALGDALVDDTLQFTVDRELWLRLWHEGRRFARLDLVLAIDRHHGARKSFTMEDVGRREDDVLKRRYRISAGRGTTAISKAYRIVSRLVGARLLRRPRGSEAIEVRYAATRTILRRQLLMPRRRMPLLEGARERH
jgi:glycosyltransferase involved in cell wall biosynthesis